MATQFDLVAPYAQAAYAGGAGFLPSVQLAQWADETAYGTSKLWTDCHNPAGIKYAGQPGATDQGGFACWSTVGEGWAAYGQQQRAAQYSDVVKAGSVEAQVAALAASPWSSSHYGGTGTVLSGIVSRFGLAKYDTASSSAAPSQSLAIILVLAAVAFLIALLFGRRDENG